MSAMKRRRPNPAVPPRNGLAARETGRTASPARESLVVALVLLCAVFDLGVVVGALVF